ncbi:hypothetical protein [Burkholderia ubonensis]|uniref:hypothetical protein n=1 Tax=Burkholderia ubonensis TaxID=101571 RepID=UPI0012F7FF14|nr:hypothetical protein [Burkholderia ubonensis]
MHCKHTLPNTSHQPHPITRKQNKQPDNGNKQARHSTKSHTIQQTQIAPEACANATGKRLAARPPYTHHIVISPSTTRFNIDTHSTSTITTKALNNVHHNIATSSQFDSLSTKKNDKLI